MPSDDRDFHHLRRWSHLLDTVFRIPGTNIRFGWDPILGLVPGLGDLSSPIFAAALLLQARRMRVPRIVLLRMLLNAGIDAVLGFVPVLGNLADIGWKANTRNMALLERHAEPGVPPRTADRVFVYGVLALLVLASLTPILLLAWIISRLPLF